jgi:hypothetical protein
MDKAAAAAQTHMSVMTQRRLPWHIRRLALITTVQPVLTHACCVWLNTTAAFRNKLDSWQAQLLKRMTHCPPTTHGDCLRQELGIMPLHMSCDLWMLSFWHRLRTTCTDRLLSQVYTAWTGAANPWQRTINKLLTEYQVDAATSLGYSKGKFAKYVRAQIACKLQHTWGQATSRTDGVVIQRYTSAYGIGAVQNRVNGYRPLARKYVDYLINAGRGLPAELIMALRAECLPLKCMHNVQRRHETVVQQQHREACPACKQHAETPAHFLLECPAYAALRISLFNVLRTTHPDVMLAVANAPAAQAWRSLLADDILNKVDPTAGGDAGGVAAAAVAAAAPMAFASSSPAAAAATTAATAPRALAPSPAAAVTTTQKNAAHAVADYMVGAWQQRSTALAGRETYGGNPMV